MTSLFRRVLPLLLAALGCCGAAQAQVDTAHAFPVLRRLLAEGMTSMRAPVILRDLVTAAPHRLSGSDGHRRAVAFATARMKELGFTRVRQESVMVPVWVRGPVESARILDSPRMSLHLCALGGSVGTPSGGLQAGVVEVHSFEELRALGTAARGKIVFFNRPMNPTFLNTFDAYGGAVDQRARGAIEAARAGAVAALVRSMTMKADTVPHTGVMGYADDVTKIPAAALSLVDADSLSVRLRRQPSLRLHLNLTCRTLPDAPSANVLGEIRGTEHPEEVIVISGHLDCWDKGQGAHDDGAGCAQALEALRLLKAAGIAPRRTIRAVLFTNEENGTRGGRGYVTAPGRKEERHRALLESDNGGFAPRGFHVDADSVTARRFCQWAPLFEPLNAGAWSTGHAGVDVTPMVNTGIPGFGLLVETQRYFDVHHSDNDVLASVNPRELELGAVAEALLAYLLSEDSLR